MSDAATPARDPFGPAGGSGTFFATPALSQRLDLIEHLLEFGRQIIVIGGETGAGKSTLLTQLAMNARDNWYCVRLHGGPALGAHALAALLAREIDVEQSTDADTEHLLAAIGQRVAALDRAGKLPVLLIDDAEELPPETVATLVRIVHAEGQGAALRIVLAANLAGTTLLEGLQRERSRQSLAHVVEIPPLSEAEVEAMIEQRMAATGLVAADRFDRATCARIAGASAGNPGKVLAFARQHLATAGKPAPQTAPPATTRRSARLSSGSRAGWAVAGVMVVLFGAWLAMRRPAAPPLPTEIEIELPPPLAARPSTGMPVKDEDASGPPAASAPGAAAAGPAIPLVPANGSSVADPGGVPTLAANGSVETPAETAPGTRPIPPSPPGDVALSAPGSVTPPRTVAETPPTIAKTLPSAASPPGTAPEPEPAPPPPAKPVPAPSGTTRARPATTEPLSAARVVEPPAAPIKGYSLDWLLRQPRTGYALQLFGVRERHAAQRFVATHGLAAQSTVVSTMLNGQPFYVVLHGYYPTRTAALVAGRELGARIEGVAPWARTIASLSQLR